MSCASVRGFHEAAVAARDPFAPIPQRLVLHGADATLEAWLSSWAEDAEHVRRTLLIERGFDGYALTVVATIASYGYGVETSLALESVLESSVDVFAEGEAPAMARSGVLPKAFIDAVLALSPNDLF